MYEGTPRQLFARYALPQMIGLLFNSVYLIVDGVFIGHRLGTDAMAAAAVSDSSAVTISTRAPLFFSVSHSLPSRTL